MQEQNKNLSEEFIERVSNKIKLRRLYGFGRSMRFENCDNHKKFLIKHRSEKRNNRYFFGLGGDVKKNFNSENDYLVLLCGSIKKAVVLPMPFLLKYLGQIPTKKANQWKYNIIESYGEYYLEIPGFKKNERTIRIEVTEFHNNFKDIFNLEINFQDEKEELIKKENVLPKETLKKDENYLDMISSHDPDFFKLTTQEQIYNLKINQIKLMKLLKKLL